MRTRNRTWINDTVITGASTGVCVKQHCGGTVQNIGTSFGNNTVVKELGTETIEDSLGRGKANACNHTKNWYKIPVPTFGSFVAGGVGPTSVDVYSNFPLLWYADYMFTSSGLTDTSGWSNNIGTIDENAMKNDVLENAKGLKADVLLNLVEANQVWPSLTSLAGSLPNMAKNWKSLRKLIKTASGSFLAWKFGVSPILSDVMAINRYMPKMGSDLKRHRDSEKSRFSVSRVVTWTHTPANINVGNNNGYPAYVVSNQGRVTRTPMIRYVLTVEPTTHYMTGFFQKLDFVVRRFATSPASLLWEKIPFSFVVDWFVDIRGALNALDSGLGFAPYKIVSFTRSYQAGIATDCFVDQINPCTGSVCSTMQVRTSEREFYERTPVQGSSIVTLNPRFGKSQAGISAALISQQLSKL
jgi:hypothetical protein